MLAKIPIGVLAFLSIVLFVVSVGVVVGGTILAVLKVRKNNSISKKYRIVLVLFSILIAALSWVFNFGWLRYVLTFMLVPFIHGIIYFLTNLFVLSYIDESKKIKILNLLYILTYITLYVFLSDGGDTGEFYFFFGLIHSNTLSNIADFITNVALLGHIALFILQIIEIIKIRKNRIDNEQ